MSIKKAKLCPDTCPTCGANLKREGYPQIHQHADTGAECAYTWDPVSALHLDWTDED